MDDAGLHDLLDRAIGQPPPTTVNVALAQSQGRRKLRWRRVYLPVMAPVAAAAAVALIVAGAPFGLGQAPHGGAGHLARPTNPAFIADPPSRLDPSVPYAWFGWLPPGFSAGGPDVLGDGDGQTTQNEDVWTSNQQADGKTLDLTVNSAGTCRLTYSAALQYIRKRLPAGLNCSGGGGSRGPLVTLTRAPDVNGEPAFWDFHGNLLWQYGKDAWAELEPGLWRIVAPREDPVFDGWFTVPSNLRCRVRGGRCTRVATQYAIDHPAYRQSAATRALLLNVAASVHYGDTTALLYPFTLSDVPASWRAAAIPTGFETLDDRLVNTSWQLGPPSDPQGLSIAVGRAAASGSCPFYPGQSQYVTVDGVQAALRTMDQTGKHEQTLCVPDVDGISVFIDVDLTVPGSNDTPLPGSAGLGRALAVFGHLRLLGPDPARWSVQPLS